MRLRSRLRILVVEDSELLAAQIVDLLATAECEVATTVAAGESEAIRLAAEISPHMVVVDLHLKEGTGFGVIAALRSSASNKPHQAPKIAVLTNYALPQYRELALLSGAHYFLDKLRDIGSLPGIISDLMPDAS